ncbi:MAG: hypothetical protein R2788_17280 [Saprospiraceae bacterium]
MGTVVSAGSAIAFWTNHIFIIAFHESKFDGPIRSRFLFENTYLLIGEGILPNVTESHFSNNEESKPSE